VHNTSYSTLQWLDSSEITRKSLTFAWMTNFRPIKPTKKLPENGDCLIALQRNPVRGTRGPFWNLCKRAHSNLATPLFFSWSSVCLSVRCTIVLHDVNLVLISPLMAPWCIACVSVAADNFVANLGASVVDLYRPPWRSAAQLVMLRYSANIDSILIYRIAHGNIEIFDTPVCRLFDYLHDVRALAFHQSVKMHISKTLKKLDR